VVGLYVAPPKKAIVLCVNEKPSIQALERAQGYLKLPNGRSRLGKVTTTNGTARLRCLQRWKSPPGRSSRCIRNDVAGLSFSTSWIA
jgi:hypothetical protein